MPEPTTATKQPSPRRLAAKINPSSVICPDCKQSMSWPIERGEHVRSQITCTNYSCKNQGLVWRAPIVILAEYVPHQ